MIASFLLFDHVLCLYLLKTLSGVKYMGFNGEIEEMVHPSEILSKNWSSISLFYDVRTENNQMIMVLHKNVY